LRAAERIIVAAATLILFIAFVNRLYTRGGPYFQFPQTIVDHVGPNKHETRDALMVLPRIRHLLPRGAHVACFRPINGGQDYDAPNFLTAVGQLPERFVQPSFFAALDTPPASLVDYVIAIRDPFTHPAYHVVAEFPEARLYKVTR
jgi:hypothetical protein